MNRGLSKTTENMGQALRRATGRGTSLTPKTPVKSSRVQDQNNVPVQSKDLAIEDVKPQNWDPKIDPNVVPDNLDQRDPKYNVMLNELLGRVRVKSGGASEMGEASIVPKYKRPLPKLRNTTVNSGTGEDKLVPSGTVNVSQLRQILLLHKGKAENQAEPMDAKDIAERFQLDVVIVQKILHYVSLPNESSGMEDKSN